MIVLINGGPALDRFGPSGHVGRLISPRAGNKIVPGVPWAADNDALKAWDEGRFVKMLCWLDAQDGIRQHCKFVAAPDVVTMTPDGPMGDAYATLQRFGDWHYEITGRGFPIALVGQDGLEDLEVPWDELDAMFIGGSTRWKLSACAAGLCGEARANRKHVHIGRVNSQLRLRIIRHFEPDSVDGTGWSRFPDKYLRRDLPLIRELSEQRYLFDAPGVNS